MRDSVWVVVRLICASALWLTVDLSRLYPASCPATAEIGASTAVTLEEKQFGEWIDGWIGYSGWLKYHLKGKSTLYTDDVILCMYQYQDIKLANVSY